MSASRPRRHISALVLVSAALTGVLLACSGSGDPAVPTVEAGARLATTLGCATCHSPDGTRRLGPTWQGIWGDTVRLTDGTSVVVDATYLTESIREPNAKVVSGFSPLMPRINVRDADIASLIAYIQSLQSPP